MIDRQPAGSVLLAQLYLLLGRLLAAPPDAAMLSLVSSLSREQNGDGEFRELARAARANTPAAVADEYQTLFVGVGRGELVPYASYYLTGHLNERPLAQLRTDMAALGIARAVDVSETEDHIAALCEMMSGLLSGTFGYRDDEADQGAKFFEAHLAPWAPRFFADLKDARSARFYAAVGTLGEGAIAACASHLSVANRPTRDPNAARSFLPRTAHGRSN